MSAPQKLGKGARVVLKTGGAAGTVTGTNMRGNLYVRWDDAPKDWLAVRVYRKDVRLAP